MSAAPGHLADQTCLRVVLILPSGTYRAPDFVHAAVGLGIEVVVASDHRQAMSKAMGDRSLAIDLCDPVAAASAIVQLARRRPVHGVVAVDDQGVEVAALAAASIGLAHNGVEAVRATRDKLELRRRLGAASVAQPPYRALPAGSDPQGPAGEVGWPVVIKPVSLAASRGVIRADSPEEVVWAVERIRKLLGRAGRDPQEPLLVESFVPGPEVAVDGVLCGGKLRILAVFDKPDPLDGPFFEETIYVTPSRLAPSVLEAVAARCVESVRAIGLTEGPIHAELRVGEGRVTLLEVAARSIGGLCSRALRFGAGISLEEVILRHAVGLDLGDLDRSANASGVMMVPIPAAGSLRRVGGQEEARTVQWVNGIDITVPRGSRVEPLPEGDRYLGFIFAAAPSPAEVEQALRTAHAALDIEIDRTYSAEGSRP